jgi:hypothetical protein
MGGDSDAMFQRAARFASGWRPFPPMLDIDAHADCAQRVIEWIERKVQ